MSKPVEFFSFSENHALAEGIAAKLDLDLLPIEVHRFPDGESLVRAESRGSKRALILRSLDRPNEKIFEVLMAADALRRQGVEEIGLIAPYLGYMRQDRIFRRGEPISQQVIARLLDSAFEEVLTVEAHLHRIQHLSQIFDCRARSVSASDPIAAWLREQPRRGLIIGPDSESEPWIRKIADAAGLEWIVASKTRFADREVQIDLPALPPNVRSAWIVDDIASSGTTLEALVRVLEKRGVEEIGAIVVHALMEEGTPKRLENAGLDQLVSTDSIIDPTNRIPLASLLASELATGSRIMGAS